MQNLKKKTLLSAVEIITASFPAVKIDTDLWWAMLSDLDNESFKNAVTDIIRGSTEIYPGTNMIALIRQKAFSAFKSKTPAEAWGEVLSAVRKIGSYSTPFFEDMLIMKAVDGVGWRSICLSENIGVERAHFIRFYEALVQRAESDRVLGISGPKTFDNIVHQGDNLALP